MGGLERVSASYYGAIAICTIACGPHSDVLHSQWYAQVQGVSDEIGVFW